MNPISRLAPSVKPVFLGLILAMALTGCQSRELNHASNAIDRTEITSL